MTPRVAARVAGRVSVLGMSQRVLLGALRRARTAEEVAHMLRALDDVGGVSDEELRAALLDRYRILAEEGRRRDPGCHVRVALLRGLRERATTEDVPLLVSAVDTYEPMPPGGVDVAEMLRATGLVVLNVVEPRLAVFHACAHLADADPMSGEPALTAVRVLGSQDELAPIYAWALAFAEGQSEVVAECLRELVRAPAAIVARLTAIFMKSDDEVVRLGLVDLLEGHQDKEQFGPLLLDSLATATPDVFRYGATMLVARRELGLLEGLRGRPEVTGDREKARIMDEASSLLPRTDELPR